MLYVRSLENLGHLEDVFQSLLANSFGARNLTPAHFEACLLLPEENNNNTMITYENYNMDINGDEDIVVKVLFDTGALCANYVSKHLINDIRTRLHDHDITYQRTKIALADDSKKITSNEKVRLNLVIQGRSGSFQSYSGDFVSIDMQANDIIIGLPAILDELWDFFSADIELTRRLPISMSQVDSSIIQLLEPWVSADPDEAPEELEVPLPAQFEFLHHLFLARAERRLSRNSMTCLMNTLIQLSVNKPRWKNYCEGRVSMCLCLSTGKVSKV